MLKGLALTPPTIGRISIGKVVERNGKRLPEKDDEFTLTSQVQSHDGWVLHPLDAALRLAQAGSGSSGGKSAKLRSIPIRLLFDDPDLSLRANYTLFDRKTGRPLCVGNGEACKRATASGIQSLPCPAPEGCEIAGNGCKPFGRLNVRIGDEDELGTFVFRTTGFNSIRTLATRLKYFHAAAGGKLSTLPLELRLRGKSTAQSHRAPIYYVDLTLSAGTSLAQGVAQAANEWEARRAAGFDQTALDEAAKLSLALGAFEESIEDCAAVIEEFYPETPNSTSDPSAASPSLADKLALKLSARAGSSADTASPQRASTQA